MKKKLINLSLILSLITIFLITSCSPVAEVDISENGSVTLDLTVIPSGTTEAIIKKFADVDGNNKSIYNKEELISSLKQETIDVKKMQLISSAGIKTKVFIPKERVQKSNLFTIDTENKYITCNLNRETLSHLMTTFPDDISEYLDLLMSPITTDEELTPKEYEDLIAAAYGPKISGELKTAFFKITVLCPGKVDSVKTEPAGKVRYFTGNSATITVPLSYILSLKKPLLVKITYK